MFTNENNIEERIQELPNDLKKEVLDYVEFLLNKYKSKDIKKQIVSNLTGKADYLMQT